MAEEIEQVMTEMTQSANTGWGSPRRGVDVRREAEEKTKAPIEEPAPKAKKATSKK